MMQIFITFPKCSASLCTVAASLRHSDFQLSARISSWHVCSVHSSVPYMCMISMFWGLFQMWNFCAYAEHTRKNWSICSEYISVPDAYAQRMHQFLTVCSGYASVTDVYEYVQHVLMGLRSCILDRAYALNPKYLKQKFYFNLKVL